LLFIFLKTCLVIGLKTGFKNPKIETSTRYVQFESKEIGTSVRYVSNPLVVGDKPAWWPPLWSPDLASSLAMAASSTWQPPW
jgi:hypothetical protein